MANKRTNKLSITTIKLEKETKARLSRLKEYEKETYEEVIRKILFVLNKVRKSPDAGNRLLSRIDKNIKRKSLYGKKQGAREQIIKEKKESEELNQNQE